MALVPFNPQDYVEEEAEEVQYRGNEYQVCLTMYCKQDNDVAEEEAAEEEAAATVEEMPLDDVYS